MRSLEEQRLAFAAVAKVNRDRAPRALRARVAALRAARRPAPVRARGLAVALGAAAVAALVMLVGGGPLPTVQQAVALGTQPPIVRVHEPPDGRLTLPLVRGAGLPFPYWGDRFGWRAVGFRRDRLGGRVVTTVIYVRGGQRIAYSIVSGPALPAAAGAQRIASAGTTLHSLSIGGRQVVTWLRRGHTCVLWGSGVSAGLLAQLGSWRGGGEIPY